MTYTTHPFNEFLDMPPWRGQRVERFRFEWLNGITNQTLGWLTPEKNPAPLLTHNTEQSIKRTLSLNLGVGDTARFNALTDRILPHVEIGGTSYPLGRYMSTSETDMESTRDARGVFRLLDEGFIIEQELTVGYSSDHVVSIAVLGLLAGLPILGADVEPTPYPAVGGFTVGTNRGQIMATYATQGDYFPYWMANNGRARMVRTKDPATAPVDFDLDATGRVKRGSVSTTSDVLLAPNRFVVVANSGDAADVELVGVYDVPPSAPHSIANRGFVIQQTTRTQLRTDEQAQAMAQSQGIRQTVFERATLTTAIDPRHDSYDIIKWRGDHWLELEWSMDLVAGGDMRHLMRKAYA